MYRFNYSFDRSGTTGFKCSSLRASLLTVLRVVFKNWFMLLSACVYRVMDACRRFGEHERSVRVARGAAKSNSSFLGALQTSQVYP